MSADLIHALEQLEKEKGIDKDTLIEAIEAALISATREALAHLRMSRCRLIVRLGILRFMP